METRTRGGLEERYKDRGSAKIRNGEFLLQDLEGTKFDLQQHPWNFVMRPGEKRYMSVTFKDANTAQQSCPRCGADNEISEGQPTTWLVLDPRVCDRTINVN
jgi:hypothetical protein